MATRAARSVMHPADDLEPSAHSACIAKLEWLKIAIIRYVFTWLAPEADDPWLDLGSS